MKFELPKEVLQEVLQYFVKRPYGEVCNLVSKLGKLKPVEEKKEKEKVEEKK